MKACSSPWYRSCRRPLAALAAVGLLFMAGCGDKHAPTKPTVTAAHVRTLLPAV